MRDAVALGRPSEEARARSSKHDAPAGVLAATGGRRRPLCRTARPYVAAVSRPRHGCGPAPARAGAAALLGSLPGAEWLIADRGYDADWFREALKDKGIKPCIPGRKSRGKAVRYDKRRYKRRNRIEIMFGRLKDWRRVATRYDRCAKTFLSAVALAATVLFWL